MIKGHGALIFIHQGKGRAAHVDGGTDAQTLGKPLHKRRFAGAQRAAARNDVAAAGALSQVDT